MLCPSCGISVGEEIRLCSGCAKPKEGEGSPEVPENGALSQAELEEQPPLVVHEDGLIIFSNFMASPLGRALSATIIVLFLTLGVMLCLPKERFLNAALIALGILGFVLMWAAGYVYAFDNTPKRRYLMRGAGALVLFLSLLGHGLLNGKGLKESYADFMRRLDKPSDEPAPTEDFGGGGGAFD